MNLQIDLNNRVQLLAQRKELQRWLEVVEFALSKLEPMPVAPATNGTGEANPILAAIAQAPARFKSSTIYNALPPTERNMAKDTLRSQVVAGKLKVISAGKGRRPTLYEKVA